MASNSSNNRINVPEARQAMWNMKHEVASELGINLKQGYNGDLTSKDAGSIGGSMVNKRVPVQTRTYNRTGLFGLSDSLVYEVAITM